MQTKITVQDLLKAAPTRTWIDVRKPMARETSGEDMPGAVWRHPFEAAHWAPEFTGQRLVVFCVHGHEVSHAVAGFLRDEGFDVLVLEGGFEAWRTAGQSVVARS